MHQPKLLDDQRIDKLKLDGDQAILLNTARLLWLDGNNPSPEALSLVKGIPEKVVHYATGLFAREVADVSFSSLISSVIDEQKLKDIAELCAKTHKIAVAGDCSGEELMGQMLGDVMTMSCAASTSDMSLGSDFSAFEEDLKWRQSHPGKIRGMSTGFTRLDRVLNGWVDKSYYVVGARPSVGKTALMCNIIDASCSEGKAVGTWSIEMPKDKLQQRCLAGRARVNLSSYTDTILTTAELRDISRAQREMKKWRWWVNDNQDCTIDQIESQATMLKRQGQLDLITIDYLQMVNIASKEDRWEQVGVISKRIRNLGRRLNVPTVVLAQLKRKDGRFIQSLNKTVFPPPEISDLRESGNIEQDADGILLLDRDIRDEEEKKKGKLDVAKNRNGSTTHKPLSLNYKAEFTLFTEEP